MAPNSSSPVLVSGIAAFTNTVPSHYVRPASDRPNRHQMIQTSDVITIPLIDFDGFDGLNRVKIVDAVGRACRTYGFFRVNQPSIIENLPL